MKREQEVNSLLKTKRQNEIPDAFAFSGNQNHRYPKPGMEKKVFSLRRMLSLVLTLCLLLGVLPAFSLFTGASDIVWDGAIDTEWDGQGTEDNPYLISSAAELAGLSQRVANGNGYENSYFSLTADILLNDTTDWEKWGTLDDSDRIIAPVNHWTPIGALDSPFYGTFDGSGHTVSGLYLYTDANDQGLFGYASDGTIINIGVIDSYIEGRDEVGGVSGGAYSTDDFITVITKCYNIGEVGTTGFHEDIGGVVGYNDNATVTYCYYLNTCITDFNRYGTALADAQMQTMDAFEEFDFYKTWEIGYQAGYLYPTLRSLGSQTYYYTVTYVSKGNTIREELVQNGTEIELSDPNVHQVNDFRYWQDGDHEYYSGAFITVTRDTTLTAVWVPHSILDDVWDGAIDTEWDGQGTKVSPYLISSAAELAGLSQHVANGNEYENSYFSLTEDILLNDTTDWEKWGTLDNNDRIISPANSWTPIGSQNSRFYGTFDGGGHTVSGIYLYTDASYQGLFGYASLGTIKNVGLINSFIKGKFCVGGVVGHSGSTINDCYNTGTVSGTDTGDYNAVGGVVGYAYNSSTVTNCYNTGTVSGTGEVGGVVGCNIDSTVTDCYYLNTCITGSNSYGTALTDAQMQTQEAYVGFDFDTHWEFGAIDDGYLYPTLTIHQATMNNPFRDVKESNWFYQSVLFAYTHGLFAGTSANTFSPNVTMTRGMLVTVLYRLENQPKVTGSCVFSDVKQNLWYTNAVIWANQNGYVNGTSKTTFTPDAPITRQDMVVILYRYAQAKEYDVSINGSLSGFTDGKKVSGYAKDAILWAVGKGMIQGSNGCIMPTNSASRAEVATILMRFSNTFGQ